MSPGNLDVGSATTRRAQGYLRWYPRAWRERYGEEFVAHLEAELLDRPVSLARTADIVAHGFLARLSFQRGWRVAVRSTAAIFVVGAFVIGGVELVRSWSPVIVTTGINSSGAGIAATPSQVVAFSFNFSTRSRASIHIVAVKLVPLAGFAVPKIVGVEFAARADKIGMVEGWPVHFSTSQVQRDGNMAVVPALGMTVNLARSNALWVGLRAPALHHVYAVEGLVVTYKRGELTHTFTISKQSTPDTICGESPRSFHFATWCAPESDAANLIATYLRGSPHSLAWISGEAEVIAQLALDQTYPAHRLPTIGDLRHWANRFFPTRSSDGIRVITGLNSNNVTVPEPEWRFEIDRGTTNSLVSVCTSRGQLVGSGFVGAEIRSCP